MRYVKKDGDVSIVFVKCNLIYLIYVIYLKCNTKIICSSSGDHIVKGIRPFYKELDSTGGKGRRRERGREALLSLV